jgi:hypothetical protein
MRMAFYGAVLFADGALGANLAASLEISASAVVEGLDGVSITTINALRGGNYRSPDHAALTLPNAPEWLYGILTRTAGSTLTASLTLLAGPLTNAIDNPNLRSATVATLATPTEARTYLGQHVQRGAFELVRADDASFILDRFTPSNSDIRNTPAGNHHPDSYEVPTLRVISMQTRNAF